MPAVCQIPLSMSITVDEYFICGPEPMMLAIREALQGLGVDNKKIHIELFTTPGQKTRFWRSATRTKAQSILRKESQVTVLCWMETAFDFSLTYGAESILDKALKARCGFALCLQRRRLRYMQSQTRWKERLKWKSITPSKMTNWKPDIF